MNFLHYHLHRHQVQEMMERLQYRISRQVEMEIEQYISRYNRGTDINKIQKDIEYLDETVDPDYGR
jgi:hypothetical protein